MKALRNFATGIILIIIIMSGITYVSYKGFGISSENKNGNFHEQYPGGSGGRGGTSSSFSGGGTGGGK